MIKKISYFFYFICKSLNYLVYLIFKKNLLIWFYSFIEEDSYDIKKLNKKKIIFFSPNHLIKFRVNTILEKEPETIRWIDSFDRFKKEIVFWDIGANVGLYSIYAASKFSNIKIIAFEPSYGNLKILGRNISINKLYDKISIMPLPLQNKISNNVFFLENFYEGSAYNSILKKKNKLKFNQNILKTFSFSLDTIQKCYNLKYPKYIKIDVDGLENDILSGSSNILKYKYLKGILIEIDKKNKNRILKLMKKNNFKLDSINLNKKFSSGNEESKNYIFKRI